VFGSRKVVVMGGFWLFFTAYVLVLLVIGLAVFFVWAANAPSPPAGGSYAIALAVLVGSSLIAVTIALNKGPRDGP
jgi:hypothetical protein